MNQWNKKPPENNSSGSQVLALGLFIMLLAFFIVLNALSTFDEQLARPVIASLERTFASRIYQDDIGQTQVQAIEQGNQEVTVSVKSEIKQIIKEAVELMTKGDVEDEESTVLNILSMLEDNGYIITHTL